ncbi:MULTISPECIES: AfsA-related hotdog domain-containing protein [Glycomyces]|uniref:AfsA-related hotdog domain-containing protein n=2 Tax=Glycomyces TaxID=58113 RepID=A0A9X3PFV3_9ACTN|nr:AfsA-related hotdog domain-containing protein [Glycomyces lechevalierae]MDA1383419.1 AfsA-related hotdog domain-containing protein [Glycomyces lechevalierae]MDR7336425.1 hypothetical protein [Glycomyces lechevalierae]
MPTHIIPVVGRSFARFAAQVGGLTADAALAGPPDGTTGPRGSALRAGQGLSAADWAAITATGAAAAPRREPALADAGLYKRDPRNILIGDLERVDRRRWRAALVVHADNAVLADRDNGTAHLPGMVEVEACSQMAMAVTEAYLLPHGGGYVFTTKRLDIEFAAFVFPLPATVELRADRTGWPRPDVLAADLTATIIQSGLAAATMRFQARVFERAHFDRLEGERAREAARADRTELLEHR